MNSNKSLVTNNENTNGLSERASVPVARASVTRLHSLSNPVISHKSQVSNNQ